LPVGGASSPAGEVVGRDHGPVRTLWASQLGPRRLVACRPREQRSTGGDGAMAAAVAEKRGAEGAAHDGEGGAELGSDGGGTEWRRQQR
jgi:hypothetical protein